MNTRTAYLSLGSNIEPEANIRSAMIALESDFDEVTFSAVYRCPAVGFEGDDFINLVACISTGLSPLELRHYLGELENRHQRDRSAPRWSNRTLDVDILLYDDLVLFSPLLEIPRNEILSAAYALRPLAEMAPELLHPLARQTMAQLWKSFPADQDQLVKIAL